MRPSTWAAPGDGRAVDGHRGRRGPGPSRAVVTLIASAGAVLVCLGAVALGLVPNGATTEPGAITPSAAPTAPAAPSASSVPRIPEDPRALLEQLAAARREHVLGKSGDRATVPGSSAAAQDEDLARAYEGVTVSGWSTRVDAAEVTAFDGRAGTAVVAATLSETEHTVIRPDGTRRRIPATPPREVVLELAWHEGRWLVSSARTA